jgi:hypothetical protein
VLVAAGCSGSNPTNAAPPRQFPDPGSTITLPAPITTAPTTAPVSTTTSLPRPAATIPPKITTTPITRPGGAVAGTLTSIDGRGNATIRLPPKVGRPAIVHAQHDGGGQFTVTAIDSSGSSLGVVAQSVGAYGGTFPIGFVDEAGHPTTGLTVATDDAWHLDITQAVLAPQLTGSGVAGHGDTVLSYRGPAVAAHVVSSGATPFTIHTYEKGVAALVVNTIGPYDARITLPKGPAFISVTATGDWSMSLG